MREMPLGIEVFEKSRIETAVGELPRVCVRESVFWPAQGVRFAVHHKLNNFSIDNHP